MKRNCKTRKKYGGFSLIEMLIVIFISSIVALAAGQTFLVSTNTYQKTKEVQKNLEDGRSSMEMMTKDIRMSSYTDFLANKRTIFMYNNSRGVCVSYQFDNNNQTLSKAECNPPIDGNGIPVGPGGSTDYDHVCNANVGNPCSGGSAYNYTNGLISRQKVNGAFNVVTTDKTIPRVGQATITMTVGAGTASQETMETTVSFRDYTGLIQ